MAAKVNRHEPKVVVAVAVRPLLVKVATGDVAVPVEKATVVPAGADTAAPVASVPAKPLAKVIGFVATAIKAGVTVAALLADDTNTTLALLTGVLTIGAALSPPPQAANVASMVKPNAH